MTICRVSSDTGLSSSGFRLSCALPTWCSTGWVRSPVVLAGSEGRSFLWWFRRMRPAERRVAFAPGDAWRVLVPLCSGSHLSSLPGSQPSRICVWLAAALHPRLRACRGGRDMADLQERPTPCQGLDSAGVFLRHERGPGGGRCIRGLWFVSHRAGVQFQNGTLRSWPWIPWWFSVLGVGLAFWWIARRLASGARPESVERLVRVVLVGSALVYLLTATIPGPVTGFSGFDDGQSLVGATLLQHGYFPWRDFQIIHGPFVDIFQALIGFVVFQHSVWGQSAGDGTALGAADVRLLLPVGGVGHTVSVGGGRGAGAVIRFGHPAPV